jgi:hypothetical protein
MLAQPCAASLCRQLRCSGFAVVPAPRVARAGRAALRRFETLGRFRYPSACGDRDKELDDLYRTAFNELYTLAARSLHACHEFPPVPPDSTPFAEPSQVEPFACARSRKLPYTSSFASLFNYDHGFLNAHVDRGLITAVYGWTPSAEADALRLWCRPHDSSTWLDVGALAARDDAVALLVGEELEAASHGTFDAIMHCVRVDPEGCVFRHASPPKAETVVRRRHARSAHTRQRALGYTTERASWRGGDGQPAVDGARAVRRNLSPGCRAPRNQNGSLGRARRRRPRRMVLGGFRDQRWRVKSQVGLGAFH